MDLYTTLVCGVAYCCFDSRMGNRTQIKSWLLSGGSKATELQATPTRCISAERVLSIDLPAKLDDFAADIDQDLQVPQSALFVLIIACMSLIISRRNNFMRDRTGESFQVLNN
jgi:hypothetical protein